MSDANPLVLDSPSEAAPPARTRLPALSGPLLGLILVLGLFILLLWWKGGAGSLKGFLSLRNLQVLVHERTIPGVLALGMLLVIISGGIDLSVGSVVALGTVMTMWVYQWVYYHGGSMMAASVAAIPAGILTGGACGLANGLIITRLRVTPFVATLGMLSIARGLAVWVAERKTMNFPEGARPGWADRLAQVHADYTFFNPGFWSLVVLAVVVTILLRQTVLGRYTYAIGSNEATARLCGVNIDTNKILIYTLAGLLAGWAGVLLLAQANSGDPNAAVGLELDVIAAVVIGGASLNGGQGTVLGTVLGVLILGILINGVGFFGVPVEAKHILIGVIIILNTALSRWQRRGAG